MKRNCNTCKLDKPTNDFSNQRNQCKKCLYEYHLSWRKKNTEKINKYNRTFRHKVRMIVNNHYGNKCVCCGENEPKFLAIDHINGGGNEFRRKTGLFGVMLASWIIKNNFPKDLQLLCHNCNQSKAYYGKCPHEV